MLYLISGEPIPAKLIYSEYIQKACDERNFWPLFAYAVACRESIIGEMNGKWNARSVLSSDGGHGLFQLTSSWPNNWQDPYANACYAIDNFLTPLTNQWREAVPGLEGDDLIRCVAASFNAGFGGAWSGHERGDVDLYTSNNYGAGVLAIYHNLCEKGSPA